MCDCLQVMKVFSKSWGLREEGLGDVRGVLEAVEGDKDREEVRALLRAAVFIAVKGLKDKVYSTL